MGKIFQNPGLQRILRMLKPWITLLVIVLVLRFTGAMAGINAMAQQAFLKTGFRDAGADELAFKKDFDYNFTVQDLNGKVLEISSLKGKTIFLNLWATWCGPCRAEMPSIDGLYQKVDHDKIVMIMLSLDREQDKNKVTKFMQDKGYTFTAYVPSTDLPEGLQVSSIPTTFVVSPDGKIVSKKVGANNYDTPAFLKFLNSLGEKK